MHAVGVPTTRALAAVTTGETVYREKPLPGAVLTRVASSHLRVGTFQFFAARQDKDALAQLLDHAIWRHYPDAANAVDPAMEFFKSVVATQAKTVAHWMSLGFIHGVMNTDNTSISGETIDYGPCAFIDAYDPAKVFSSIDTHGRYAYQNQPDILVWNLAQLGGALLPLMAGDNDTAAETATAALRNFPDLYLDHWLDIFRGKIGLGDKEDGDVDLIRDLLQFMASNEMDFTNTFRGLADDTRLEIEDFEAWKRVWRDRRSRGKSTNIKQANPAIIPRNHQIEALIDQAVDGDFDPFFRLHSALQTPFDLAEENTDLMQPPAPEEEVRATFCGT